MALGKRVVVYGRAKEDGPDIDRLLRERGFQVYAVEDEDALLDALQYSQPDCAILAGTWDLQTLSRLVGRGRSAGHSLILVVRTGMPMADAVSLLEQGADYVSASSHPDWLTAQIRAGLRRAGRDRAVTSVIELGYLSINLQRREVLVDGQEVNLTRTEFEVLRVLAERPGTVLPSGEIMQNVMGVRIPEAEAQDLLKVHIHRLRQKLERDLEKPRFIKTVRGEGYRYAFERRARERDLPQVEAAR